MEKNVDLKSKHNGRLSERGAEHLEVQFCMKRMPGKKYLRVIAAYWAQMRRRCQSNLQQNPIYIMEQINNG